MKSNDDHDIRKKPSTQGTPSCKATDGWWRWPLVPLVAPIAAIAGTASFSIVLQFCFTYTKWIGFEYDEIEQWYYFYAIPLITSGVFGFLWSLSSGLVAPLGKTITAVVMTTVLATYGSFLLVMNYAAQEPFMSNPFLSLLSTIATLAGSVIAVRHIANPEVRRSSA